METGRELFVKFLRGEPLSRPAFIPLIRGLPARVDGISREKMNADPTLWANSLKKTVELFGLDGVVAGLDFTLMAEACGCKVIWANDRPEVLPAPGGICEKPEETTRMKNALEAARRVFQVCRSERACVAAITGPVTLASQLFGREEGADRIGEVKTLVVRITEAFCQIRPDVIIFMEGRPLALNEVGLPHRRIYNTLKNIVSHYDVCAGLYLQGYTTQSLGGFSQLKMDIYVLGPSLDNNLPPTSEVWALSADALGVGLSLPVDDIHKARQIIHEAEELCSSKGGRGFFLTSFGPLTRDIDLDALHQLVSEIRQVRL